MNQNKGLHGGGVRRRWLAAGLGWRLGDRHVIEPRHADARTERLPALAQDLAARKPAVIVASPSSAVVAAAAAAPTTPVVRMSGDSPLAGLVKSLARPGGMVTGLSSVSDDATLKSFGPDQQALIRRSAYCVDRILKGAKPGDLPIEEPTTFELVVNLKAAKALGIVMPPAILVRATTVLD